jgi:hypothetical protein
MVTVAVCLIVTGSAVDVVALGVICLSFADAAVGEGQVWGVLGVGG